MTVFASDAFLSKCRAVAHEAGGGCGCSEVLWQDRLNDGLDALLQAVPKGFTAEAEQIAAAIGWQTQAERSAVATKGFCCHGFRTTAAPWVATTDSRRPQQDITEYTLKQSSRTIPSARRSAETRIHLVARTKALKHAQTDHVAMLWGSTVNDDTGEREPAWCPAALLESPILQAMVDRPEGVIACDGREIPLHIVRALIRGAKACVQAARSLPAGEAQTESANAAQDALYTLGQLGVVIPEIERAPRSDAGKGGAL